MPVTDAACWRACGCDRKLGIKNIESGRSEFIQNLTFLLSFFNAGQNVRKLIKDGFIIRKPQKIHSRSRARASAEAKAKGRHTGYGKLITAMDSSLCVGP